MSRATSPSRITDSRQVALQTLLLTDKNVPVQAALDAKLRESVLTSQDRALASELVYGVLRTRLALDAELEGVLTNPRKLPTAIRHILALGLYSLRYAERIPDHAALDTAVRLARRVAGPRMGNLVNACLRKLSQEQGQCFAGGDVWHNLLLRFAMPPEIMQLWRKAYGDANALRLLRRSFARPWAALRVNASFVHACRLATALAVQSGCVRMGGWGFAFAPGEMPQVIEGETVQKWQARGALSFQAAASQLVMEKLGLYSLDGVFWDCCCGVGGKSLALLERGVQVSLSSDTSSQRLEQFARDCQRLGIVSHETVEADASTFVPDGFDGNVLVDAPCSSMGVLARRPDVKKRAFTPASLEHFVETQRAILNNVAGVIRPGRYLAYMTCTLNPAENEEQMALFCRRHGGFDLCCQWQTPHDHPWLEGMFGALLRRRVL